VLAVKPVRLLVKLPKPLPLMIVVFAVVGEGLVLKQTPRCVMSEPPSLVMLPPEIAVVSAIELIAVVVRVAKLPGLGIV
jgi:hypothetical protein